MHTQTQGGKGSLSIQSVPSMNITGGIYRWRYTSHVSLLFYPLTTVISPEYSQTYTCFPYYSVGTVQLRNAHNPRRSSSPRLTKTAGPTDHSLSRCWRRPVFAYLRVTTRRIAKTGHLRACSWRRLQCSWCIVFAFRPEDKRRWATSMLAVGIGFRVLDFLSSRSFGDRPEGGVPNSSVLLWCGMW